MLRPVQLFPGFSSRNINPKSIYLDSTRNNPYTLHGHPIIAMQHIAESM